MAYSNSFTDWALADNVKEVKTVYLKVRDYVGNISTVAGSSQIEISDYTRLPGVNTSAVTISKNQGPYSFDVDVSFKSSLTIGAGTEIYFPNIKSITVEGILTVSGQNGNPVKILPVSALNAFGGFQLTQGAAGPHDIQYLQVGVSTVTRAYTNTGSPVLTINGGSIKNSSFYLNADYGGVIRKSGIMSLTIQDNLINVKCSGTTLAPVISLEDGNSIVKNNNIYVDETGITMSGLWLLAHQGTAVSSTVTFNTLHLKSTNGARTGVPLVLVNSGTMNFSYNQVENNDAPPASPATVETNASGAILNLSHNNLSIADKATSKHLSVNTSGGTINAGNDNFYEVVGICGSKLGGGLCCGQAAAGTINITGSSTVYTKCSVSNTTGCVGSTF